MPLLGAIEAAGYWNKLTFRFFSNHAIFIGKWKKMQEFLTDDVNSSLSDATFLQTC